MYRARGFYFVQQYGRAVTELTILLDSLRARDEEHLLHWYDSKEMFEYMIGMAELAAGRTQRARDALGRALAEDLSFYMAHARLADIARYAGNLDMAVAEYDLAVGLKPDDGALRYGYGDVLLASEKYAEAEAQLLEASRLEPYWAQPYFDLGVALLKQERDAEALAAFEAFLARCPRRLTTQVAQAKDHIGTLHTRLGTSQ